MLAYAYNAGPQTLSQEGHELEGCMEHFARLCLKRNKRQNRE